MHLKEMPTGMEGFLREQQANYIIARIRCQVRNEYQKWDREDG